MKNRKLGKIVKWFSDRGYGFIKEFETGETYFVYIKQIHDDEIVNGSVVEFAVEQNKKNPEKLNAVDVYVCEAPGR